MYLVQILLPLFDNQGRALPRTLYETVSTELSERFGGLTAHTRAPAEGFWKMRKGKTTLDEIIIYEVMLSQISARWWTRYRQSLEHRFRQQIVVVRAQRIRLL